MDGIQKYEWLLIVFYMQYCRHIYIFILDRRLIGIEKNALRNIKQHIENSAFNIRFWNLFKSNVFLQIIKSMRYY